MEKDCPICATPKTQHLSNGLDNKFECQRCGSYLILRDAMDDLPFWKGQYFNLAALLSHYIRTRQLNGSLVGITNPLIQKIAELERLPTPFERINKLLLEIGKRESQREGSVTIGTVDFQSIVGAATFESVGQATDELLSLEFLRGQQVMIAHPDGKNRPGYSGHLTTKGWEKFYELTRLVSSSDIAFMAMQFGNSALDKFVDAHIRGAVKQTGFALRRLDDQPKAGLIDDRLRIEIRNSRFLLADLTHGNKGAYWEAGFAEGLGLPVIYLCKRSVFKEAKTTPHFDTNHHLTIDWEEETAEADMERLKATIRFSIPDAQQKD